MQQPNGLFKNYADDNNSTNFDDASSSALLAATVYRLVLLTGNKRFVQEAERTRAALFATNGTAASPSGLPVVNFSTLTSSSTPPSSTRAAPGPASTASSAFMGTPHFTVDGWLAPVVDPLNFAVEGAQSPEGQAFVLMLESAWRDWSAAGRAVTKSSAPTRARVRISTVLLGVVGFVVASTMMMDGRAVLF